MIQLFYNKEDDAVLLVEDGILKSYDEGIQATEFLPYFEVEEVEELRNVTKETIIKAYEYLQADCKFHSGIEGWEEYLKYVSTKKIIGELLITLN